MKIKLIEDFKTAHKLWSVRLSAIGIVLMGFLVTWPDAIFSLWSIMPEEAKFFMPQRLIPIISLSIFALTALSRLIKQNISNDKTAKENVN